MEQQTLITLIGLVVAVVALIVGFASLLHFSQKSLKEDLGKRIDGVQHQLGERITGVENQLGERIDQLDSRLTTVEGKVDTMAKADDVREGFAMLRRSLDTLERRTFDIATGTAEA